MLVQECYSIGGVVSYTRGIHREKKGVGNQPILEKKMKNELINNVLGTAEEKAILLCFEKILKTQRTTTSDGGLGKICNRDIKIISTFMASSIDFVNALKGLMDTLRRMEAHRQICASQTGTRDS